MSQSSKTKIIDLNGIRNSWRISWTGHHHDWRGKHLIKLRKWVWDVKLLVRPLLSWVRKPSLSTCNLEPRLQAPRTRRRQTPSVGLWRDNCCSSRSAPSLHGTTSGASPIPGNSTVPITLIETPAGRGWGWRAATTSTATGINGKERRFCKKKVDFSISALTPLLKVQ